MRPALAFFVYAAGIACAAWSIWGCRQQSRAARVAAMVIATATASGLLLLSSGPLLIDFEKAYLYAGRSVLVDPLRMYACDRAQCFVNIPIVSLLFVPFAPGNATLSALAFSELGVFLFVAGLRRLTRFSTPRLLFWLAVVCGPLYYSVRIGNTTHMLLFPLAVAFEWLAAGRETGAALILAAVAIVKPPLGLFLPYFVVRGRAKAAAAMAVFIAAALGVSIGIFGFALHLYWFREFVVHQGSGPIAAYNVQSVNGALAHLMTRGHVRDWYPMAVGPLFKIISGAISGGLVLAAAAACWRAGRPRAAAARLTELWIVLCLCLLVAPISWTHYYLLLLIPLSALLARWTALDFASRAALGMAILLVTPPAVVLELPDVRYIGGLYERVLLSHYFFGGVVLLGLLIRIRLQEGSGEGASSGAADLSWRDVDDPRHRVRHRHRP